MKKIFIPLFFLLFFCIQLFSQNTWLQKANFPGAGKDYPAAFSIGDKGYWGTGADIAFGFASNDFWEFDPTINIWTQKANFPGVSRWTSNGFSIGSKGYLGLGYDANLIALADLWEYNPSNNSWIQKASCPIPRGLGISFAIGNYGYVGTGATSNLSSTLNDFWEYNPATDSWTQKASFAGNSRSEGMGFAIGNKGYIGTGYDFSSGGYLSDFWEWDQATNVWTQKANFPDGRVDDTGFSIGCKGYLAIGESQNSGTYANDLWEYDPAVNSWTQKASIGGVERDETYAINIGCKGYLGFGQDVNSNYLTDMWEYTPDSATQACCSTQVIIPPLPESSSLSIPNVFTPNADGINDYFFITSQNITTFSCEIYDRWGTKIYSWSDITKGWDGKDKNGNPCTDGVYYFIVDATGIDGAKYKRTGFFTLIR